MAASGSSATGLPAVCPVEQRYDRVVGGLRAPCGRPHGVAGRRLRRRGVVAAVTERYESQCPHCSLVEFAQSGATYLFDLASAAGAGQEDRTVAAWAATPVTVAKRDVSYQRGFPLPPDPDGALVDRGHLIPHRPAVNSARTSSASTGP